MKNRSQTTALSKNSASRSVLLVESSTEEREVLRMALEIRGLRIWEAGDPEEGLAVAREQQPDIIVLDLDAHSSDRNRLENQFVAEMDDPAASLVILGKARRGGGLSRGHVVSKPYHYGPLIHTIEQLAAAKAA